MEKQYIPLGSIEVYRIAVKLSDKGWTIYQRLTWQERKTIGDQMITAVDSVGANIAEGYGRFHYKDRIRFYYNARGSLFEVRHWILLMQKRLLISREEFESWIAMCHHIHEQINVFIKVTRTNSKK